MKQQIKLGFAVIVSCVLTAGLVSQRTSYATVPGNNLYASNDSSGNQVNDAVHGKSSMSYDGRFVAFATEASNVVSGDTNAKRDVFVKDVTNNSVTRVSVSSSGVQGNGHSNTPQISYDGRYVVFGSNSSNLISGQTINVSQIYIHDRQSGTTDVVSKKANGSPSEYGVQYESDISADGRFVVFSASDRALVSGTGNIGVQVYVRDMVKQQNTLISKDSSGNPGNSTSASPSISCDGGVIAFYSSATNLPNYSIHGNVYVDIRAGGEDLVNITVNGNGSSSGADISCDGNFLSFVSNASNLVSGDGNGVQDAFRYSNVDKTFQLISKSSAGVQANFSSESVSISGDGRFIVFQSIAPNLILTGSNNVRQIYLHDAQNGTTERISVNSSLNYGNGESATPSINGNGKYVTYYSEATNLMSSDTNGSTRDLIRSETGF